MAARIDYTTIAGDLRTDIHAWARGRFGEKHRPSQQQILAMELWSLLLRAKLKRKWNQEHPDKPVILSPDEKVVVNKIGMSIMSGHGTGKDCMAVLVGLHFLEVFHDSRCFVTAPAGPQLQSVIWPEFYKWIAANDKMKHDFEWNAKRIWMNNDPRHHDHWIQPRTINPKAPADEQAETIAGLHATFTLRIIDEASGVPDAVMQPFEGGMTDPVALIFAIFNPTRSYGFAVESHRRDRDRWLCVHWDAEELAKDPPDWYNPDIPKQLEKKYGRESNFYRVRVKGLPPVASSDTLIPWDWVLDATRRTGEWMPYDPILMGVDVAGEGTDRSVVCVRRRDVILEILEKRDADTTRLVHWIEEVMLKYVDQEPSAEIIIGVDALAIGKGVFDVLRAKRYKNVHPIVVSQKSTYPERFVQLRDQLYWDLRTDFEEQRISIPQDDSLIGELTALKLVEDRLDSRIQIARKKDMREALPEGITSPDKADAMMFTCYLKNRLTRVDVLADTSERNRRRQQRRRLYACGWKGL